jgi:glucose-1-phosphate thymidylyltransferase
MRASGHPGRPGAKTRRLLRLLANGKAFGLSQLDYTYQEARAASPTRWLWLNTSPTARSLRHAGRHIVEGSIRPAVEEFRRQRRGAKILLREVQDAERFGVAEIVGNRIVGIEEKPKRPKSNYAVMHLHVRSPGLRQGPHTGAFARGD